MKRLGAIALVLICLSGSASADEFGAASKYIESHFEVRRTDPHLIGFALLLANPQLAVSASDRLQMASFENKNLAFKPSLADLDQVMAASLSANWQYLLRLGSRGKGTATAIYVKPSGENIKLLIGSIESNEIGLAEIEITAKDIRRWIANATKVETKEATSANKKMD